MRSRFRSWRRLLPCAEANIHVQLRRRRSIRYRCTTLGQLLRPHALSPARLNLPAGPRFLRDPVLKEQRNRDHPRNKRTLTTACLWRGTMQQTRVADATPCRYQGGVLRNSSLEKRERFDCVTRPDGSVHDALL